MKEYKLHKKEIAGIDIIGESIDEIIEYILNHKKKITVSTLSMPMLGELKNNTEYFDALKHSEIVLPDGIGIIILSKIRDGKNSLKKRIAGPDFFIRFNYYANREKLKYFFMGSTQKTLSKIEEKIKKDFPDIIISGTHSPPFGKWDEKTDEEIIRKINELEPDVLWVAMTAPKQEIWVYKNRDNLNPKIVAAIGAAFDFYAGTKKRAPEFFRKLGLEWFYRTIKEPLRMGKRYLKGFTPFINYFFRYLIKRIKK